MRTLLWTALLAVTALPQETVTFKVSTNLVVVNVEVKDRNGKSVPGLKAGDFEILENGKPQRLSVFEFQELESSGPPAVERAVAVPSPAPAAGVISASKPGEVRYRDRRLIVLFFDLSSMSVAEQIRARKAAEEYFNKSLAPNDLVALMTFSSQLKVLQDFTGDKDLLFTAVRSLRVGEGSELASSSTADESVEDTGAAFTADSSEFDIFNTDRKLGALEDAVRMLTSLPEKKALVYFSSGVGRTGVENESQLRSTVNAAIRANVAFYPVDARGLVAEAPAGDVSVGSMRGDTLYSGQAQRQRRENFNAQQETLYTLASDTGGKAMLDNNQLSAGIVQAQKGFSSYYVLGYYTSDPSQDGKYRRVEVKLKSPEKLKLDYRAGYFAPKSFAKYNEADKERQLEEALRLGDPVTDLPVALEVDYFRRARDRYVVPVAVKIPGSEIPIQQKKEKEEARLDFIAEVRDAKGHAVANVRDFITIRLSGDNVGQLSRKMLEYDTAFTLPPGEYRIKFVTRENLSGKLGTFETKFVIPDLATQSSYLRASSVVWGNQRIPLAEAVGSAGGKNLQGKSHPLVHDGQKLIPSVTKVVREGQDLYVLMEVYEPGENSARGIDLAAGVSLYGRKGKVLESEPLQVNTKADVKSPSVPIELRVPLEKLPPGDYVCQLSVIDRIGGKFAFGRTPLVVLPVSGTQ